MEVMLPLKRYGQFANLLAKSPAPLVDVDTTFSFITRALPAIDYIYLLNSCNVQAPPPRSATSRMPSTCWRPVSSSATGPQGMQWVEVPSCGRVDLLQGHNTYVMHTYLLCYYIK